MDGTTQAGPEFRFPPPFLYAGTLAASLLANHFLPTARLPGRAPRRAGLLLTGLGVALGVSAIATMRRVGESPRPDHLVRTLVTNGPYRFTRNPMYLGMTVLYTGAAALANSLAPFLALPFVLRAIERGVVVNEERYLEQRFGDAYRRYRARVPRWL
ncbi:MAG: methyltransferase family protein [Chloroflexota bacterium]